MPLKGTILEDHIPMNKYKLKPVGLIDIVFTEVSGLEKILEMIDLPDRTRASGGNTQAGTFTAKTPMHHTGDNAVLGLWFKLNQDPIQPLNKLPCTMEYFSGTGNIVKTIGLIGVSIEAEKTPDVAMENEGELATIEWTFSYDDWATI